MLQIVVVDNEPDVCKVIDVILGKIDAEIICATTSDRGADILASRSYDLALIDMIMRGDVSTFALLAIAADQNTSCLLMSGHRGKTDIAKRFRLPCLEKPFGVQALLRESKRVMEQNSANVRLVKRALKKMNAESQESQIL